MPLPRPASALFVASLLIGACAGPDSSATRTAEASERPTPLSDLAGVGYVQTSARSQDPAQEARMRASSELDGSRRTAIVEAAARVAPAVVNVSVIRTERVRPRSMWESFFMAPGGQRRSAGVGSGVLVRDDGIVLTNDHVVRDAERIKVTLADGRDFDAELLGTDQVTDIAVLRVQGAEPGSLPVAPVGSSEGLLIGEWAIAIGNPFASYFSDAEPTVTAGVISALDRNIVPSSQEDGFYLGMIQTDASINPGNSGGPLVNALGEVVGINASIFSRSGGSEGLGFAIPIDRALRIADDLVAYGEVRRAWTGLDVEAVEADEWGRTRGVRVSRVAPGSPADRAAIEPGDRLLAANDRILAAPLDFEALLLDLRAGDAMTLRIEGQPRDIPVVAAALPSLSAERITVLQELELITVTPQIRSERGLASEDGALVASISDRLSGQLGLRAGDVLVQIQRTRVRSAEEVARIFEQLRGTGSLRIYLERGGQYVARDFYWR
ncbi:MAG: trypsin-like peptidase domain-containing protein [Longimicrobiales bacterium]